MIQISVILCTYNRAHLLKKALESLIRQTFNKALYEIIIVNNASTDNTDEVVKDFKDRYPSHEIRYVYEKELGLGYARNRGLKCARGDYIAFIDDDAYAKEDWLQKIVENFFRVKPTPFCIGGQILPFYDAQKPKWFKDEYEVRTWGQKPRFLTQGETFSGSNIAFRRCIFDGDNNFDVRVGIRGKNLLLGEETTLFEKMWEGDNKPILYYSPNIIVYHLVPVYKMTVSYRLKRSFASGQSWYLRYGPKAFRKRARLFVRLLLSVVKLSTYALTHIQGYPAYQNWMVERLAPVAGETGRLAGCLGLLIPVKQR